MQWIQLGADGAVPVFLGQDGRFSLKAEAHAGGLVDGGHAIYAMARLVNGQYDNPFLEAGVGAQCLHHARRYLAWQLGLIRSAHHGLDENQRRQFLASAGVVLLSMAEIFEELDDESLARESLTLYFELINTATDPFLKEKLIFNLDWVSTSLPDDLTAQVLAVIEAGLPLSPPYEAWFRDGNTQLNISWKCGPEFLSGWLRRLEAMGFEREAGPGEPLLVRTFKKRGDETHVRIFLGAERSNVFDAMNDGDFHIIGYDGHSDWGRKIPKSLEGAPEQVGEKAILYLLCCGKQILQKVRDQYPRAHVVTTFNSAKFTKHFSYSEDFTAFTHILKGFVARETWSQIRKRVNGDWQHNPEKNYIFPIETLEMARSLDRDHDGQADIFDRLIDYNTFAPIEDTAREFEPMASKRAAHEWVGTSLHLGVQVFHTLAHFNQNLVYFAKALRVFAGGFYDPAQPIDESSVELGLARVRCTQAAQSRHYHFQANMLHAHASEEMWRAVATYALAMVVPTQEGRLRHQSTLDIRLNALLMVVQGLSIDEGVGRDQALWQGLLKAFNLPGALDFHTFQTANSADKHWYAGSKKSIQFLKKNLDHSELDALSQDRPVMGALDG